jgi:hypothetical protein
MSFNANKLLSDRRFHSLLIGPSGAGKTAAACTFPGKTFILDFDDRAKGAVRGCTFLQDKVRRGEIEIETILPWKGTIPVGLKEIYEVLESLDNRVTKGEIENVILDSTTSLRKFLVNESINKALVTSGKSSTLAHMKIGEAIMSQKQDYNYATTAMSNIIYDNLKTFRCNLFVSTHYKDKVIASPTNEDPERVITVGQTITAPGQLVVEIPSWFDEAWEFEVDASIKSSPPRRYVVFQGQFARTAMRDLGYEQNGKWTKTHRLEITDKNFYEVLKPTLERMKTEDLGKA